MAQPFSLKTIFQAKDQLSATITKLQAKTAAFRAGFSKSMKEMDGHVGAVHGKLKGLATTIGATALAGGAGLAVLGKAGADFEEAISGVGAVSLMARDQIKDLEKEALRLGSTTKFTATEAANAMEVMARAGFTNSEVLAGVGGILNAAAAEGAEMAEVANHVSNVLKGMGLEAKEAGRVSDVLALASARTNSSISSLGESMKNLSPVAKQFGIGLEDAVGMVALLQDVGLDASEAGTATATMLTKLAKPADGVAAKMEEMGVAFKDAKGNMLPPLEVFKNMQAAAGKLGGNIDQVAFFADLVGLRGQKAALNLKDLFAGDKGQKLTEELRNAAGSAEKMAKLRMDNLKGDLTILSSTVEGLQVALFQTESGPLRDLVKGITEWIGANQALIVSGFTEFMAGLRDNLPTIVTWLERVGKVIAVFYAFAGAVKVLNGVLAVSKFLAATNPVVLWTYAIIAAIALIWAFWPEISAFFSRLWEGTKEIASRLWTALTGAWDSVVSATKRAWNSVMGVVGGFFDLIKPYFLAYLEFVVGFWTLVTLPARLAFRWIWFAAKWAFDAIRTKALEAASWIAEKWEPIGAWFAELWAGITSVAGMAWDAIAAKASEIWSAITGVAQTAYGKVTSIWSAITGFFEGIWDGIASGFRSAMSWVLDKLGWIVAKGTWLADLLRGVGRDEMDGDASNDLGADLAPPMFTPAERTAHSIEEKISSSSGELVIKDQTGRAEISRPFSMPGMTLRLSPTGAP